MSMEQFKALLTFLREHVRRFAVDIEAQYRGSERLRAQARRVYEADGVGEDFEVSYLPRLARRNAVSFTLKVFFLRVLEDRGLLEKRRVASKDMEPHFYAICPHLGAREYLEFALREGTHLLPDLFQDQACDLTLPGNEACQAFLDEWRRVNPDTNRPRYDFSVETNGGFDTRVIGDIYESLDEETVKRYALCQTPEFISQFILEHTLLKCFEEKDFSEVTLIDPTCGSGHFLLDAFWHFASRYEADPRFQSLSKLEVFRKIVKDQLFGADIVELSCELTRFRLLLAGLDYVGTPELRRLARGKNPLRALSNVRLNVACCDSLIPHEYGVAIQTSLEQPDAEVTIQAQDELLGDVRQRTGARHIFYRKHDVCVGNPPYVLCDDRRKREFYRTGRNEAGAQLLVGFDGYKAASGKYQLGAPFTERFFRLVRHGGWVGLINSNAFARATFGKVLVENVLPAKDLHFIADLSGVFIPGHGTPTVVTVGRERMPQGKDLWVLSCLQGEASTPEDPTEAPVWQAVRAAFEARRRDKEHDDGMVALLKRPREVYSKHPWSFGSSTTDLLNAMRQRCGATLAQTADSLGFGAILAQEDAFIIGNALGRIQRLPCHTLGVLIYAEGVRDYSLLEYHRALIPYDAQMRLLPCQGLGSGARWLRTWIALLGGRPMFDGSTYLQSGKEWWSYHQLPVDKYGDDQFLAWGEIASHNHYVALSGRMLFNRTAPIAKLDRESTSGDYVRLSGILNSSVACFLLKMVSFKRGYGERAGGGRVAHEREEENFYAFRSTMVGLTPLPALDAPGTDRLTELAQECTNFGQRVARCLPHHLLNNGREFYGSWYHALSGVAKPDSAIHLEWRSAGNLRGAYQEAASLCDGLRARMVFLQEEMDWLCYQLYGLVEDAPLAIHTVDDAEALPRLDKEDRPFRLLERAREQAPDAGVEEALALLPAESPAGVADPEERSSIRGVWRRRLEILLQNDDVALIETLVYKRRWQNLRMEERFRKALEDYLLEAAEYALEHWGGISCVTGVKAGDPYLPCEEVEPELRARAMEEPIRPVRLDELAHRLTRDERVAAAMEVYAGTEHYDPERILAELMVPESVPASEELLYTEAGLRKLEAWGHPWKLSDEAAIKLPKPPEFKQEDFRNAAAWKLRGKLNVPRERFIHYREMVEIGGRTPEPGDEGWFGWAGWDPRQRADALCWLLERFIGERGIQRYEQCALRVPLRKIVSQGQLEAKKEPQPSISPLPPCDVSPLDLEELTAIATDAGHCGRPLHAPCPCPEYRQWLQENAPVRLRRGRRATAQKEQVPGGPAGEAGPAVAWKQLPAEQRDEIRRRVHLFIEGQGSASLEQIAAGLADVDRKHLQAAVRELVASTLLVASGQARGTTYAPSGQMTLLGEG